MDFLYRMPLVDFDPNDNEQIKKNWNWIKKAIQLSSASLFAMIENQDFDSLSISIQTKIQKYLLRGRYRSTPFGLWAGVGLGKWGKTSQIELPITFERLDSENDISSEKQPLEPTKYQAAPGLIAYANQVHYWSYCQEEEGWRISYLDKNKLVTLLLDFFEKSGSLDFNLFQSFFKTKSNDQIRNVWKMLIKSGVIISENFHEVATPTEMGLDIRIKSNLILDNQIQEKLDGLMSEIGDLFVSVESEYLENFKAWFNHRFDDRFIPLTLLAHQKDFFPPTNTTSITKKDILNPHSEILKALWNNAEEFDLSKCYENKQTDLQHVQIAFKIFGAGHLFIENIVCNRPFAYSGRFSLDPEIKKVIRGKVGNLSSEAVFADVILFESKKSNHISRHENIFEATIFPFGNGSHEYHLGINDLYLGIREDRLILYSKKLNKQVIPAVQHPLNPNQITHTLSRLFWEIGNQDQFRFLPYHDPAFQNSRYLPRLTWKGILLQGKKWILNRNDYTNKSALSQFLDRFNFPSPILAGHLDRELLLDWRKAMELDFLWEELQRLKEVTVYECPWKDSSPFQNQQGQQLYPQIIYSWKGEKLKTPIIGFLNPIQRSDSNWNYARIGLKEDGLLPFLQRAFPSIISELKEKYSLKKWYFLIYNLPKTEIRLRLYMDHPQQNHDLSTELSISLTESGWVDSVDFVPYYPEFEKYGLDNKGVSISESIFHLESEMVLMGNEKGGLSPVLKWGEQERRTWIICLYFPLIEMSRSQTLFFNYFQKLIKEIPGSDRKELNKAEIFYPDPMQTIQETDFFDSEYSKLATAPEESLLKLIPNHIHMCCNRAFPNDTAHQERLVIYGLYRKLGKSVYGRLINL